MSDLITEKYLKAAEKAREQRLQDEALAAAAAAEKDPSAGSTESLQSQLSLSKVLPVMLACVAVGWLYTHRSAFRVLIEPIGVEGATNALLRFNGEDYEYRDTMLGRMAGDGEPFEMNLPEIEPVQIDDEIYINPIGGRREHDPWYEALPGE